jgi:Ca-activated chloride channel family protein
VELIFWWLLPAWAVIVAVVAVVLVRRVRRARRADTAKSLPIAHRDRLTALPGYARALRRYRRLLLALVAGAAVLLVASVALSARPASVDTVQPDLSSRDIVLCLDVSGSMVDYDERVIDVFGELAEQFTGERISLVVFNASAVTRFPLTSDYDYIARQFAELKAEFRADEGEYYSGTLFGDGSSLVGDGLASCAVRFDAQGSDRSRSVILVTDNLLAGEPIFTLPEAGALAEQRDVRVYGINPGDSEAKDYLAPLAAQFRSVIEHTGGAYFAIDDASAVPRIVDAIEAEQAAALPGQPEDILADQPAPFAFLAFLGLAAVMFVGWRLKR